MRFATGVRNYYHVEWSARLPIQYHVRDATSGLITGQNHVKRTNRGHFVIGECESGLELSRDSVGREEVSVQLTATVGLTREPTLTECVPVRSRCNVAGSDCGEMP
jgi:hypothetical protein